MNIVFRSFAALAVAAIGTQLAAQSNLASEQTDLRGRRVQVGVVIPFGSAGDSTERAPRIEAWSEAVGPRDTAPLRLAEQTPPGTAQRPRIGITLQQQPRMMLNGREAPGQDPRKPISTWVVVGVGVVAALVVGGFLLADAFKDANN